MPFPSARTPRTASTATAVLAAVMAASLPAQQTLDTDLVARKRLFPSVSAGVVAIQHDATGRYAVLTERAGVELFDAKGQPAGHVPADGSATIGFGVDMDVDEQGRLFVADRAKNAIEVFSRDGQLERQIHVDGPTAVATLAGGEVAVASLRGAKLITVYGAQGQAVRQFGEPEQLSPRADLNQLANLGRLCRDTAGRIYYSFTYLPEPTVKRFDRFGNSDFQLVLNTDEYAPLAMSARKALARDDGKAAQVLHTVLGPVAIDPTTGEIWMTMSGRLLRFFSDGTEHGSFLIYTPEEERIEASALLIEAGRIVVASSRLGVYELPRPATTVP